HGRLDAERDRQRAQHIEEELEPPGAGGHLGCVEREQESEHGVAERAEREHDGEPVEPGVVATHDEQELMENDEAAGNRRYGLREEEAKWHHELDEMTEHDAE